MIVFSAIFLAISVLLGGYTEDNDKRAILAGLWAITTALWGLT